MNRCIYIYPLILVEANDGAAEKNEGEDDHGHGEETDTKAIKETV